jgi:tetratricopeptide (TPR) repeat protein
MRVRVIAALVIALSAIPAAAGAQPSTEDRTRALELFEQSADHYKRGEFERAAELLREAYGLYPEPLLVYNLARALEGVGDLPGAIENYERYLTEATTVDDRPAIERRIATLKEQLARTAPGGDTTPTPPVGGGATPPVVPGGGGAQGSIPATSMAMRDDEVAPRPSMAPFVVAGGGVAIAAAGGVFAYLAGAREDDAHAAPVQEDAARLLDDARGNAKLANVLFVAGGSARTPMVAGARVDVAPAWVGLTWELR